MSQHKGLPDRVAEHLSNSGLVPTPKHCLAETCILSRSSTRFAHTEKSDDSAEKGLTMVQDVETEDPEQHIATQARLDELTSRHALPEPRHVDWHDRVRYQVMSTYRRLFALAFVANAAAIAAMVWRATGPSSTSTFEHAATAAGANLVASVVFRHEHTINRLFDLALAIPTRTPICVKRHVAKVAYSYGGLHAACGCSAMLWYLFYTVLLITHEDEAGPTDGHRYALTTLAAVSDLLLAIIIALAHPYCRKTWHNTWENTHRWGGYTLVALVFAQVFLLAAVASRHSTTTYVSTLISTPTFWFLLLILSLLLYPWLRLRRVPITWSKHSDHAIRVSIPSRHLNYHNGFASCRAVRVTDNPWRETHAFATIAPPPDMIPHTRIQIPQARQDPSILISRAGDWTAKIINAPPSHLYIKGAPTTGVMRLAALFSPVLIITTGSGIGPCMSFFNTHRAHPMRILWSARSPVQTYGPDVMRDVLFADPEAVVVDTAKSGKLKMVELAWGLWKESEAKAVVIISNPKLTGEVVYGLERRGVPVFGAIFDS